MAFDTYFNEVRKAMLMLAEIQGTLFVGQSVRYDGHALYRTMQTNEGSFIVPMEKRIELPVIEDFQMGYCTGLALSGFLPVSIFPRWDFLLLAANQLVNHLDKMPLQGEYRPKVIVRTTVGATYPRHSGQQHTQDHSAAFKLMLKTVEIIELRSKFDVVKGYERAIADEHSCVVVEQQNLYNDA